MSKIVSAVIGSGCGHQGAPAQRPCGRGSDRPGRRPHRARDLAARPRRRAPPRPPRAARSPAGPAPGQALAGDDASRRQQKHGERRARPSETAWPYDTGSRVRRRAKIAAPWPVLRFARDAAHLRDRRHRLRRQGGRPRASCARLPRPLPRPAGLRARPQGLRVHRPRARRRAAAGRARRERGGLRAPSCTWSASSASSAARGVTFERLHTRATRNMLAARARGRHQALRADERARHAARRPLRAITGRSGQAEEAVRASDLDWTIFRPVHHLRARRRVHLRAGDAWSAGSPVVPVLGDGRYRLQPIAVEQVAEGFVRALRTPEQRRPDVRGGRPRRPTPSWRSST